MKDDTKNILCPKCGESISIDDVLTSQVEDKLRKEIEKNLKELGF